MQHFAASHSVTFDAGFQHIEFLPRRILQHTPLGRTHRAILAMPKIRAGTAVVCHQLLTSNTLNLWHSGHLVQICVSNVILFVIFVSKSLHNALDFIYL